MNRCKLFDRCRKSLTCDDAPVLQGAPREQVGAEECDRRHKYTGLGAGVVISRSRRGRPTMIHDAEAEVEHGGGVTP